MFERGEKAQRFLRAHARARVRLQTVQKNAPHCQKGDFNELTDSEVLRRAAREAAIATALVWKAIKDRITKSDFDLLELTPALSALGQSMHALPGAFEQAIDARGRATQQGLANMIAGVINLLSCPHRKSIALEGGSASPGSAVNFRPQSAPVDN